MVDTAFQTVFRSEAIQMFERTSSVLRSTVTTAANVNGDKAVFLVAGSDREAVTRGPNGLIPAATGSQTQYECVLEEWHDLPQKTNFDVVRGQADQRRIMQENAIAVINRKIDAQIIDQLNLGTLDTGTAQTFTKKLAGVALTTLFSNNVPNDGQIYGLLTPAAWEYLTDEEQFSSADYVDVKPNQDGPPVQGVRWKGCTWMMHTGLPGMNTNQAKCFVYHKHAVGHAYNKDKFDIRAGYDDEQDYHWVRTSMYMNAKLLQNNGVVVINHDDSFLLAS